MKPTTISKLNSLTPEEKKDLLPLVNELLASKKREECQDSFMKFIKNQWSAFIEGPHHKIMAEAFEVLISLLLMIPIQNKRVPVLTQQYSTRRLNGIRLVLVNVCNLKEP